MVSLRKLGSSRKIHVSHHPAAKRPGARALSPLLFIHGGYVHGGCWDRHFIPYFTELGYDCHAVDLSGHGKSEGRERIDDFGLDDYVDDATQAISEFDREPVLIAHSMGTAVAERLMEASLARAAVMMAPLPPGGTSSSIVSLALRYPRFFSEISNVIAGRFTRENLTLMRDVYFSPDVPAESLVEFAELIQPESQRAITEMMMYGWRFAPLRPNLPVLVIAGEHDAIFPPYLLNAVARRWEAEMEVIAGAGHVMMLEPRWLLPASRIANWLGQLPR